MTSSCQGWCLNQQITSSIVSWLSGDGSHGIISKSMLSSQLHDYDNIKWVNIPIIHTIISKQRHDYTILTSTIALLDTSLLCTVTVIDLIKKVVLSGSMCVSLICDSQAIILFLISESNQYEHTLATSHQSLCSYPCYYYWTSLILINRWRTTVNNHQTHFCSVIIKTIPAAALQEIKMFHSIVVFYEIDNNWFKTIISKNIRIIWFEGCEQIPSLFLKIVDGFPHNILYIFQTYYFYILHFTHTYHQKT